MPTSSPLQRHLDWGGAELWYGDDRCVPPGDDRSNQRLVQESLLDRVLVPPFVHPIPTRLAAEAAATAYDAELRGQILDLVLLGLGADGHTASLFPHAPSLEERERLALAVEPGLEPFVERITLTIPALESAGHVVFLVVGEGKADAVRRAFAQEPSPATPASLVRSRSGATTGDPRRGRGRAAALSVDRYRGRSLWLDGALAEAVPRPALDGDHEVDVAIAGAGFTGLWTAYALSQLDPALRIAIVEAETVGYGASGRNGGFVSAGIAGEAARLPASASTGGDRRAPSERWSTGSTGSATSSSARRSTAAG